jgi:hypothetical protein
MAKLLAHSMPRGGGYQAAQETSNAGQCAGMNMVVKSRHPSVTSQVFSSAYVL